jgi:hypothetical protein
LQALTKGSLLPAGMPKLRDRATALLNDGEHRLQQAISARQLPAKENVLLDRGTWSVALVIEPSHSDALPDAAFLNRVSVANPQYTGWPIWLDSRAFDNQENRPKVVEKAWQTLIVLIDEWSKHIEFMRIDPRGELYLWQILQDDTTDKVSPGTTLDPILVVIRVAEALAVGLSIADALGWQKDSRLGFAFRWTKLSGRVRSSKPPQPWRITTADLHPAEGGAPDSRAALESLRHLRSRRIAQAPRQSAVWK